MNQDFTSCVMTGTVWTLPAVSVEQIDVSAGLHLRGHGHDVPHLCFLERGSFVERARGRSRPVDEGTLRISPAGDEHDIIFRAASRCLLVMIHGDPAAIEPRLPDERHFCETPHLQIFAERLSRSLSCPDSSPLDVEVGILELLAATLPPKTRVTSPPSWLRRVRDQLHGDPASPPSTTDLAADAGLHPVYVARAFRQYFGIGVAEYARVVRAEHARILLATTEAPIAEIALLAGYADQSHLTRSMRRLLAATPSEIRQLRGRVVQVAGVQEGGSHAS
jgi:AraC family transcriptional regulator